MRQVELKFYLSYLKFMLRRCSHFFACLLLLLMPLQSIAAASMLICNSMMQVESQAMQNMPCHQSMNKQNTNKSEQHQSPCKTVCATLCASFSTMATLPVHMSVANFLLSTSKLNLPNQVYASVTQASLQRPPIFLA
jgi:hypothetical protein